MAGVYPPDPLLHPGPASAAPGRPQILPGNPGGRPSQRTPAIDTTAEIMNQASAKAGIPPWLLWGIFGAESSYGKSSNWFGLVAVPRSSDGPNGSPTFSGDAQIAAHTLAGLLRASSGNTEQALMEYSGNGYQTVGKQHGFSSGEAYIASLARQAPLKINVPVPPLEQFAAGPAGGAIAGTLKALATPGEILSYLVTHLADPHFWLRVLEVVGGFAALALALHELVGGPDPIAAAKAANPAGAARAIHNQARSSKQINLRKKAA